MILFLDMSEQLDAPAAPKGNLFNVEVVGVSREMRDDLIFKIRVEVRNRFNTNMRLP